MDRVVELTNQERAQFGLPPLTTNTQLAEAAQIHTENMTQQDFFDHTELDDSSISDRVEATGYGFLAWAENIGAGYETPEEIVEGWMNNAGHRANIFDPNLEEIGVGYFFLENDTGNVNFNHYWAQVFETPVYIS